MNFDILDKNARHSREFTEQINIYKLITKHAQENEEFRNSIDMDRYNNGCITYGRLLNRIPKPAECLNIAILGYKTKGMDPWDPFTCASGLPGSEECVVYASQSLAKKGHRVTLYFNPPKKSIWRSPFSNPRYLEENEYDHPDNKAHYDLLLMWRRFDVETGRRRADKVFFWPHDILPPLPPNSDFPKFDGLCMLSRYHYRHFMQKFNESFLSIPHTICGNGVLLEQFTEPMSFTNPYSVGYYSNYSRGLIILLIIWPIIKQHFPLATLDIYYGREHWGTLTEMMFNEIINLIEQYKSLGVTEHGKVGHIELAQAMQHTSIWAYPCTSMGETFCITAVKCQLAGMIPVVTPYGALEETVSPHAIIIKDIDTPGGIGRYCEALLGTMENLEKLSEENSYIVRRSFIQFASKFTWDECVERWLALYYK